MAVYDEITDGEIDAESPWTAAVTFKMRDNPLAIMEGDATARAEDKGIAIDYNAQYAIFTDETDTDLVLKPDGVDGAEWGIAPAPGAGTIDQASLDTSTGTVDSTTATPARKTVPGGQYAFYPESRAVNGNSGDVYAQIVGTGATGSSLTTTFRTNAWLGGDVSPSENIRLRTRFINASPPFDLGDGQIPLFVFVEINSQGKIIGSYVAPIPPWAYAGPTRLRPDILKRNKRTGKVINKILRMSRYELKVEKYNRMKAKGLVIPTDDDIRLYSEAQEKEYMDEKILVPIDQERKNRDMDILPTHADPTEGITIGILDPPATERLYEKHESGVEVADLLLEGHIEVQNDTINRAVPAGVTPVKFRWKNTGA